MENSKRWFLAAAAVKRGDLAVIPTDTIYGIVASSRSQKAVNLLYKIRGRQPKKPCIILSHSMKSLSQLGIHLEEKEKKILSGIWPNPVSVILPCRNKSLKYLHRGSNSLAVRIPKSKKLRHFLMLTGPIIAPSANKSGMPPAKSVTEAKKYFDEEVAIYVSGKIKNQASTLIKIKEGKIQVIREGLWKVPKKLRDGVQL